MKKDLKITTKDFKKAIIVIIAIILLLIIHLLQEYILPPRRYLGSINYTEFEYGKLKLEAPAFFTKIGPRKIIEEAVPKKERRFMDMQIIRSPFFPVTALKGEPYCSIGIFDRSNDDDFSLEYVKLLYGTIEQLSKEKILIKEVSNNKVVIIKDSLSSWPELSSALFCGDSDNLNKYKIEVNCSKCSSPYYCRPSRAKKSLHNKLNCRIEEWIIKHWCPEIEKNQKMIAKHVIESLECK